MNIANQLDSDPCSQVSSKADEKILQKGTHISGKPRTALAINNLPATRFADFVNRAELLEELDLALLRSDSTVNIAVLIGMGGSGKTQLAMKYCQLHLKQYDYIFWADATNEQSLKQSYNIFADVISKSLSSTMKFPDLDSSVRYVVDYLRSSSSCWLIVFDNYDIPSKFENIRSFIPDADHGRIIITSRHRDAARLGIDVEVNGMREDEALELLLKRTGSKVTGQDKKHGPFIVDRLGYLPLAIDQAGSYIRRQNVPLREFIGYYNKRAEHIMRHTPQLWEYKRRLSNKEEESRLSVFTTWELSFAQLESGNLKKEIELINFMGFLHHKCISEDLFQAYHEYLKKRGDPKVSKDLPIISNADR